MKKLIFIAIALFLFIPVSNAQQNENEDKNVYVRLKEDGVRPDVYVNGIKFDFPLEIIDKNIISSMSVLKGEEALALYNSKNGVILITTKVIDQSSFKVREESGDTTDPIVIIDGKVASQKQLKELAPGEIESIDIDKSNKYKAKFKTKKMVIDVKTKKATKKK